MSKGAKIRDDIILKTLEEELLGPCAYGEAIEVKPVTSISKEKFNQSFITISDNQEILKVYPTQRYGIGVIYPVDSQLDVEERNTQSIDEHEEKGEVKIDTPTFLKNTCDSDQDFDISLTNTRAPSAIGLSFLLNPKGIENLTFKIQGSFYQDFKASMDLEGKVFEEIWWYRKPFEINLSVGLSELYYSFKIPLTDLCSELPNDYLKNFFLEGVVRKYKGNLLFTVSLVNRGVCSTFIERNRSSLFQSKLSISVPNSTPAILPYPEPITGNSDDISNLVEDMVLQVTGIQNLINT
jgi:hypothetical protein